MKNRILYTRILIGLLAGFPLPVVSASAAPRKAPARISPLSDSLRRTAKAPDAAARDAFRNFIKKTGTDAWRVRYSPKTALPEALVGAKTAAYPGTPHEAAIAFLNENEALLKVRSGQLRPAYSKVFMGVTHLQYDQIYNSIPVEFSYVRVHVDPSGRITGYQAKFEPEINVPLSPAFPAVYAQNAALADLVFSARAADGVLVLFPDPASEGALKLAWKVRLRASDTASGVWVYYVGAADGRILFRYNDLRYACPGGTNTSGTVRGSVYRVSPMPSGNSDIPRELWTQPVPNTPINNQYMWVTDSLDPSTRTAPKVTGATAPGEYCAAESGKVFASLKGPYFSVVNFRGPSAHFDNGGGVWRTAPNGLDSPHPYESSKTYQYQVVLENDWTDLHQAFAKVMPHFTSFSVGEMGLDGSIGDSDELDVKNGTNTVASYIGVRAQPFFGAAVENSTYGLTLNTDASGVSAGFSVDLSSYLVLTNTPLVSNNATGSVVWSTGAARVFLDRSPGNVENDLAEVNVFYHLNSAYDYFKRVNLGPGGPYADLDKQVPVMVHAHGAADTTDTAGGMQNAFYDLEKDNIFIGDGPCDDQTCATYRSFALDGTIIRHEYSHRVVNQIYPIINFGEFGAISEAVADYFSLASLTSEGNTVSVLANFVSAGSEGYSRDLSLASGSKSMPADWNGEVHDDSLILSQALWQLKNNAPATNLGNFGGADAFPNMPKADVFAYAALFYFPDNFANFYDAFVEACRLLDPAGCPAGSTLARINTAFNTHGIPSYGAAGDAYDQPVPGALCENNNGPECSTDVSTMTGLSATVFPEGDVDYYVISLQDGNFTASLNLPPFDSDFYYAYALFLFDANRNYLAETVPVISNSPYTNGTCPLSGDCLTATPGLTLTYPVSKPGRYYLLVSGAPNQYYNNSRVASTRPYSLNLSYAPKGSAWAELDTALYDQDTISFTVPNTSFPMISAPSSATLTGGESSFEYAQLRDHDFKPIDQARTNYTPVSDRLLSVTLHPSASYDGLGRPILAGSVGLNPGFAARYPGVGTVYLEVFGRDHMGKINSLGVSNAINLTTNKSDLVAYNNILTKAGDRAIVKYDLQSGGDLTIKIYTVTGALVKTLFSGAASAGKGILEWDGTNLSGSKAASGIYYVKAKGPGLDKVDKIAVVR
ncbi:MAG: FlgD immunoglobulin-like domain containing protein [Elusimicrobiales bacterium]